MPIQTLAMVIHLPTAVPQDHLITDQGHLTTAPVLPDTAAQATALDLLIMDRALQTMARQETTALLTTAAATPTETAMAATAAGTAPVTA